MAVEFTGHMHVTIANASRVQIPVTLSNVNYAPTIRHNLFSISAAIRARATVVLNSGNGRIIMSDGTEFPLEHWNGLMVLRMSYVAHQSDFAIVSISNAVWHSRTGHLSSMPSCSCRNWQMVLRFVRTRFLHAPVVV
jgi:hypothetical protein